MATFSRRPVEALADTNEEIAHLLRDVALESIWRLQARILILGRVTANQKMGAFLMEMERRSFDASAFSILLTMSRYDIADYLSLSVETVSRALTSLRHRRWIELRGKHEIKILDRRHLG